MHAAIGAVGLGADSNIMLVVISHHGRPAHPDWKRKVIAATQRVKIEVAADRSGPRGLPRLGRPRVRAHPQMGGEGAERHGDQNRPLGDFVRHLTQRSLDEKELKKRGAIGR